MLQGWYDTSGGGGCVDPAVEAWVRDQVEVLDITAVRSRPWAAVWRVESREGLWWAKVNSARTGYEGRLLQHLAQYDGSLLPRTIAAPEQPWALVADAGIAAREAFAGADRDVVVDFWCGVLSRYAELQRSVSAADLFGLGVPELTPSTLVRQYDELIADTRWFSPICAPDYSSDVHRRVLSIRNRLAEFADELASGVPPSVQHDDLHSANVFTGHGRAQIIDWGDAVVAHPFLTMRVALDVLADELGVHRDSAELRRVTEAYLSVWQEGGASRAGLNRQLDLALRVAGLGRAAGWARALGSPEAALELDFGDAVAHWMGRLADDVLSADPGGRV